MPASAVIPLPDTLSFAAASLIEPFADVMHGIDAGGAVDGKRCAVFGLGPMGLLHVQALRRLGAHVVGADPRADRRETALHFGAHAALAPDDVHDIDRAYIVTGGPGLIAAAEMALDVLNVHGSLVLFASAPKGVPLAFDPNRLHYLRQRIVGVVGFEARHADQAIALLLAGAIDVDALRTPSIGLDDVQSAFESAGEPGVLKAGLDLPGAAVNALTLGVDLGSHGARAVVMDGDAVIAQTVAPYGPPRPPSRRDPAAWWDALVDAVRTLPAEPRAAIDALAVTGVRGAVAGMDAERKGRDAGVSRFRRRRGRTRPRIVERYGDRLHRSDALLRVPARGAAEDDAAQR